MRPKFEKGQKAGPGRPKGSQDKKYLNLKFWFDQLENELAKEIVITRKTRDGMFVDSWKTTAVDPNKRAQIFLEAMKMLTAKMKNLPNSQDDSINNVDEAMKLLEQAEGKIKPSETFLGPSTPPPM